MRVVFLVPERPKKIPDLVVDVRRAVHGKHAPSGSRSFMSAKIDFGFSA